MTLVKTSLLNGIAVIVKMLTLLGINKILAVYVGPAGYAALGQFQNAVQMITTFASGAINNGVTKYTAEYHANEARQRMVWQTAGTIALVGSLATSLAVAFLNRPLAAWILKDPEHGGVFLWFAASLVLFTFNTLLMAILNGKKEIARYVVANIAGSIFAFVVTTSMAMEFGLYGALVALAVYQSITFFVTFLLCFKASWFKVGHLLGAIDKQIALNLAKYTAMALTSAVCVPISHILIRNHLGETIGWSSAGQWEAMIRLSSAYLMAVTSTLSIYFLPRLSEIQDHVNLKKEIFKGYKLIIPSTALLSLIVYLSRDWIVVTLFTRDFSPMTSLFFWQLLGDVCKMTGWLLGYLLLSKSMTKLYISTEIIFSLSFYLLVVLLTPNFGLMGAAIAHFINYAIYSCLLFFALRKIRVF